VPFNFAPVGWAMCDGQLLPISQNTALFSLLGTYYGGNGVSTFALPNLQGMTPLAQGSGTGLTARPIGSTAGSTGVTLTTSTMPGHSHTALAVAGEGTRTGPSGNETAQLRGHAYGPTANSIMSPAALGASGGGLPHNNLPPYVVVNLIIALTGIYPPRS
jgi:microcystin-dependent protein